MFTLKNLKKILNVDDAVTGMNSPMDYQYMKWIRFVLRVISSWPSKELGEKQLKIEGLGFAYYNTGLSVTFFISGISYLKLNFYKFTFFELGNLYILLLMNLLTVFRSYDLCLSQKYRKAAAYFIQEIHLFYFKETSEFAKKIHERLHIVSHIFSAYLLSITFFAVVLCNVIPMYCNYAAGYFETSGPLVNGSFQHSVYCLYPFDFEKTLDGYIAGAIIGGYASSLCGCCVCAFDLLLCLMIFNLWGHFKILIHNLDSFPRPAAARTDTNKACHNATIVGSEMYSKSELEDVAIQLKECIEHHKVISNFTNRMSDAFGFSLGFYYFFHQVAGCLLLLQCSDVSLGSLTRYIPVTTIIFGELILISVIFESIGSMSEKLKDAVYNVPWEYMDTKNRKTVLIFLIRVQEPIHVKAGGMVKVGVTTMASILRTSLSYYAFIRKFS